MAINDNHYKLMYILFHRLFHVKEVTNDYSILVTDFTIICNSSRDITITLPVGIIGYSRHNIKNIGTGKVQIRGLDINNDTIDDEQTQELNEGDCVNVQCIANNDWRIV